MKPHQFLLRHAAIVLLCLLSKKGYSELYFPPELVSSDPQMIADLSRFNKIGAQLPGYYLVDIYVNGKPSGNRNLKFIDINNIKSRVNKEDIRDKTGLMACLTRQELDSFGVKIASFPALQAVADEQCISPGEFIPAAFTSFDFQRMRLGISIPQAAMRNDVRDYISPERWDNGINAGLLNYSFSGNSSHGRYGNSSSQYLNLNSGLNLGAWRFRDYRIWNAYNNKYADFHQWQHIKSYAARTIIPLRSELTLGDSNTSSDVFDSLGIRGAQIATDDSMYPDSLRGFAPAVRGTARTNAQVSIRQSGYIIYQTYVSPGAFVINDLYPMSSSGDLEVSVKEADGSVQRFIVPYSTVPVLQREGYLKYAAAIGKYQSGSNSYNHPQFMQGTLIWGGPYNTTLYGGLQYAKNYVAGLIGTGLNLGRLGALSADVTQANSTLADGNRYQGQSLRFLYARSFGDLGTTFQLTGYRYSTQGFHTLDETALKGMEGWRYDTDTVDAEGRRIKRPYTDYYNLYNNKRAKIQANISQRIGQVGSIYLSGVQQSYWNSSNLSTSLQAGFNSSVGSINYNLSYQYNRDGNQPKANKSVYASFSVPLAAFLPAYNRHSIYLTYNLNHDKNGKISSQAGANGTLLDDNRLSWSISQGYSRGEGNNGNLRGNYQGEYGNSNLGYSYSNNYNQISYGVSGGAILHRNGLTLGQPMGDTSILVAAPGISGVNIENETGVKTDWRGYAIKPYASVYRENRVALDTDTLDIHTDIDKAVSHVIPTRGAVVRAVFKGSTGNRILMTLHHKGKPLPFGSIVSAGESSGIVGDDGQVFLSGMPDEGIIQATWGDGVEKQCSAHYRLPEKKQTITLSKITQVCR